jgi:glycosyltransferase involved in cell wall biosynthesis
VRILHILNDLSNQGSGIVNVTVDIACEQAKQGHEVAIAAGGGEFIDLVRDHGVQVYLLDQSRSPRILLTALVKLRRFIRGFQPDLIHAHMRTGLVLAWINTRLTQVRLVAHLHNVHDRESSIMRAADRVIAVSESVKMTMVARGIPKERLRVVLNGPLGSPRTAAIETLEPKALRHPAIVTVAGMNHRKGVAELIQAFGTVAEEIPGANLYLVGDGPERVLFEGLAAQSGFADRIHFEGYQSEPQAYMLASEIFVLASRRESIGLVLMEAREAGCAIIATDVDGIPEALDHGEAGILVPANDPAAMAESIQKLLHDDQFRRTMQRRAHEGWECFSCNRMANDVEKVYRELLSDVSCRAKSSRTNATC